MEIKEIDLIKEMDNNVTIDLEREVLEIVLYELVLKKKDRLIKEQLIALVYRFIKGEEVSLSDFLQKYCVNHLNEPNAIAT